MSTRNTLKRLEGETITKVEANHENGATHIILYYGKDERVVISSGWAAVNPVMDAHWETLHEKITKEWR